MMGRYPGCTVTTQDLVRSNPRDSQVLEDNAKCQNDLERDVDIMSRLCSWCSTAQAFKVYETGLVGLIAPCMYDQQMGLQAVLGKGGTGGVVIGDAAVALATPSTTSTMALDIFVKGSSALTMKAVSLLVGNAARMGLMKYARPSHVTGPTCPTQTQST